MVKVMADVDNGQSAAKSSDSIIFFFFLMLMLDAVHRLNGDGANIKIALRYSRSTSERRVLS